MTAQENLHTIEQKQVRKEVKPVSDREKINALLDDVPDYKMGYVIAYLQGLTADEESDDRFCQRLIEDYENDPDEN